MGRGGFQQRQPASADQTLASGYINGTDGFRFGNDRAADAPFDMHRCSSEPDPSREPIFFARKRAGHNGSSA